MQNCTIDLKIACEKNKIWFWANKWFPESLTPSGLVYKSGFSPSWAFPRPLLQVLIYILTLNDSPVTSKVLLNSVVVLHTNLIGPGSTDRQVFNFWSRPSRIYLNSFTRVATNQRSSTFCSSVAWQSFCSSKNCVFRKRVNLWWPNSMYTSVKLQVLIYHGNGCGPRPADCKFNPANSTSKYWKEHNIYMEDIHFQFWRFWYDLVGLPPPPQ